MGRIYNTQMLLYIFSLPSPNIKEAPFVDSFIWARKAEYITKTCKYVSNICVVVYPAHSLILLYHPTHPRLMHKPA